MGCLIVSGSLIGLQDPASANQVFVTFVQSGDMLSVGAGNGGTTPGAKNDGWYQFYAEAKASGGCAVTEAIYNHAPEWEEQVRDCSVRTEGGVSAFRYLGANAAYIRVCWEDILYDCGPAKALYDDGT